VAESGAEGLRVRYPNKEEQSVPLARVRVQPELWKQVEPTSEEAAPTAWSVGDRVIACWHDLDWYPGVVLAVQTDRMQVLFDTGTLAILPLVKVRPLTLTAGERVMCRRKAGRDYYTGQIAAIDGEKVRIRYDDGSEETTVVRLLRLRRDDWFLTWPLGPAEVGMRVLAQAFDLFWYPARLLAIDGKRLHVGFADGDQGLVTPDQVKPLDISAGSRIFCRRRNEPQYVPCQVIEQDGNRLRVAYEDGSDEWTTLRLVRVER
jgi:hypothetical protein